MEKGQHWHLAGCLPYQNLRERLKELMDHRHASLPMEAPSRTDAIPAQAQGIKETQEAKLSLGEQEPEEAKHSRTIPATPYLRSATLEDEALQKGVKREKRIARFTQVRMLRQQGVSVREIARRLQMSRSTIRRFIDAEDYPEREPTPRSPRPSQLDPYKSYVLSRWQQGCRNSVQLWDEIKARGYPGSARTLRTFLALLRKQHLQAQTEGRETLADAQQEGACPSQTARQRQMSSTRASWLFLKRADELNEKQRKLVEAICTCHPDLQRAYPLVQDFVLMLAEQRACDLDRWLLQMEESGLAELKKMAKGLRMDYAAVQAALSSQWSNGQVEAQVNCLKLQKRIVFGRANFDLLRLRVLCRI